MQGRFIDPDLLGSFDSKLIPTGGLIYAKRKEFIEKFLEFFVPIYKDLSQGKETPELQYESTLSEGSFADILYNNHRIDSAAQRTTFGIHKDDLQFNLDGLPLKKFGSQGQIKCFIIALKLAQYRYFQSVTQKCPLLLLDDIFEKIDADRAQRLIELVGETSFGQILITDTHASRVETHFSSIKAEKLHHQIG
ncbi:MAG: hypothetical protein NTZ00_09465 [Bacteroidetes bacterium]|nr:hypothetical protein [Bacteroidota bacterium]